ncbi:MAG: MFS transporter [Ktedonobacteraceae bacterium]
MHVLKVLRIRHLAILWLSQVLSAMGDYLYEIAVMWIAVKVVGSGAGIVAAAEAGSMLVFGLLGGVYADRWNRRTVMICVDILRAIAVVTLPVLALTGILQLWHLVVVAVVVGSLGSLFNPALQASLPALTGDTHILQATNSLMDVTRRLARILGPSMAGILIALLPLPHFFTLDAVSFAVSAIAVFAIGTRFAWRPVPAQGVNKGLRGILAEIKGAMLLLKQHKLLGWALSMNGVSNLVWSAAFTVGVPLFTARVLASNVGAYGLIVSAYGVGNVISNLVVGSLTIRHRAAVICSGKIVLASGFLVLAFAHTLALALLGAALAAIGGPMVDIVIITMMQTDLPANQVGKVYSLSMIMESGGASLGLLLAVPLFAYLRVPIAIALCALVMLLIGVVGLVRFGVSEPGASMVLDEQHDMVS